MGSTVPTKSTKALRRHHSVTAPSGARRLGGHVGHGSVAGVENRCGQMSVGRIETVILSTVSQIETVRAQWRSLAQADPMATIFQDYTWCRAHLSEAEGKGSAQPFVVAAFSGDEMLALLPLELQTQLGTGTVQWIGGASAVYGDALCRADIDMTAWFREVIVKLAQHASVDLLALKNVPDDAYIAAALGQVATRVGGNIGPYLDLSQYDNYQAWRHSLSRNLRKNNDRRRRNLAKLGDVSFEMAPAGPNNSTLLDELFSMKRDWASERAIVSRTIGDTVFEDRLREAIASLSAVQACFSVLRLERRPIAIELGYLKGDRYCSYMCGYDLEFHAYSPGALQFESTVQACFNAGLQTVDLMPPFDNYKRAWTSNSVGVGDYVRELSIIGHVPKLWAVWDGRGRLKRTVSQLPAPCRRVVNALRAYAAV